MLGKTNRLVISSTVSFNTTPFEVNQVHPVAFNKVCHVEDQVSSTIEVPAWLTSSRWTGPIIILKLSTLVSAHVSSCTSCRLASNDRPLLTRAELGGSAPVVSPWDALRPPLVKSLVPRPW